MYKVVTCESLVLFEKECARLMKEEWNLHGDLVVTISAIGCVITYHQAFTKSEYR